MMVIEYTNGTTGAVATVAAGATAYFPADRCTWTQSYDSANTQYDISGVRFYDGVTANGVLLTPGTSGSLRLGQIGKSGRFVAFTS